jgi:hypothetical protein
MWILPNNYQLSSAFAADMVASKEDLTLPGLNIESSLMWRSKPSPLPTWSQRWNRVSWFQRLSSRILKPSQRTSFEAALTLSLEATRASRFQQQVSDSAPKTPDTYGPTSLTTSMQLDLFDASLKTSRDTSALDSEKSLATWKASVIEQRGAYSARLKSVHRTSGSESTLWRTPSAQESGITIGRLQTKDGQPPSLGERMYDKVTGRNAQYGLSQQVAVVQRYSVPTPTVGMEAPNKNANTKGPKNLMDVATGDWQHLIPQMWQTPVARRFGGDERRARYNSRGRAEAVGAGQERGRHHQPETGRTHPGMAHDSE